jgi:hypothetical protein
MMDEEAESPSMPSHSDIGMDSIFNTTSYTTRPLVELDFKPWHKPRKQLVRDKQWGNEIDWLLQNKPASDISLRYLGLPGPDLLDVRYIYDRFCRDTGRKLTFLGFEKSARSSDPRGEALNVSMDEVRRLEHVDGRSLVLGDDFSLLAKADSIASDWAAKLGPFDVINVDLTKSAARDDPSIDSSLYNAIHRLFGVQQRYAHPWSFFLTSRVGKGGFSQNAFVKLLDNVQRNLKQCPPFEAEFRNVIDISAVSPSTVATCDESVFFKLMGIALAKWLLGLAIPMRSKYTVQSSFGYRVQRASAHCDMLSIVLRFQPVNTLPVDGTGLASAMPVLPSECSQAAKIPQRISHTRDVDEVLDSDPDLWSHYLTSTASLLEQARYDPAKYREWVESDRSQKEDPAVPRAPS